MRNLLLLWALSAVALWVVSQIIPGFRVDGAIAALVAVIVIGFVNGTLGFALKAVTFPFAIITLGLFWLIINALMLMLVSAIVPGFHIDGFWAAFFGGIVLSFVNMIFRSFVSK